MLTLPQFAERLRSTWSIMVGAEAEDGDLLRSNRFGPLDHDEDLRPNTTAFRALLVRLGLAVEPSDGLTLVAIRRRGVDLRMARTAASLVSEALAAWILSRLEQESDFAREGLPRFDLPYLLQALSKGGLPARRFSLALVGFDTTDEDLRAIADANDLGELAGVTPESSRRNRVAQRSRPASQDHCAGARLQSQRARLALLLSCHFRGARGHSAGLGGKRI